MKRRHLIKSSALVWLGLHSTGIMGQTQSYKLTGSRVQPEIPEHFPHLDPEVIAEVVGKSHFDLDRVKELVEHRVELAKAVWEWRFGDFESAIGAASHVGRRDIALYLLKKGARPTLFTLAMLGEMQVLQSAIDAHPGIQKISGPHGFSLLHHAHAGMRMKDDMSNRELEKVKRTIDYLETLGDANGITYMDISENEQEMYLGDYKYGPGEKQGFTIKLNMRKMMALGPIGEFGGALYKLAEHEFTYNGAPSVKITFEVQQQQVKSLTLTDPDFSITAEKVI